MYAVERLSSYITRGVYTVSGPFHPFGGAVDIIVVEQQDGSFKSSPWNVRFGKFQGVLKTKEKIVDICVNGADACFHMYLDHKGEAYFLGDAGRDQGGCLVSPPSSGDDETERQVKNDRPRKAQGTHRRDGSGELISGRLDVGSGKMVARTASSRRPRILGFVFGRRVVKEEAGNPRDVKRISSLERAEIAADLLEMKWSTNLSTSNQMGATPSNVPSDADGAGDTIGRGKMLSVQSSSISSSVRDDETASHGEEDPDKLESDVGSTKDIDESEHDGYPELRTFEEVIEIYSSEAGQLPHANEDISTLPEAIDFDRSFKESVLVNPANNLYDHTFHELSCNQDFSSADVSGDENGHREVPSFLYCETSERSNMVHDTSVEAPLQLLNLVSKGEREERNTECMDAVCRATKGNQRFEWQSTIDDVCCDENTKLGDHTDTMQTVKDATIVACEKLSATATGCLPLGSSDAIQATVSEVEGVMHQSSFGKESKENIPYIHLTRISGSLYEMDGISEKLSCHMTGPNDKEQPSGTEEWKPESSYVSIGTLRSSDRIHELHNPMESVNFDKCDLSIESNITHESGLNMQEMANDEFLSPKNADEEQFLFDEDNFGTNESLKQLIHAIETDSEHSPFIPTKDGLGDNEFVGMRQDVHNVDTFTPPKDQRNMISIPKLERNSEEKEQQVVSLPDIYSYIHDLENHDVQPTSHSSHIPSNSSMWSTSSSDISMVKSKSESNLLRSYSMSQDASANNEIHRTSGKTDMPISRAIEMSLCRHLLFEGMGAEAASKAFDMEKVEFEKFATLGPSLVKDDKLVIRIGDRYFPWNAAAPIVLGIASFGREEIFDAQGMISVNQNDMTPLENPSCSAVSSGGSWTLWPFTFKKQRSMNPAHLAPNANDRTDNNAKVAPLETEILRDNSFQKPRPIKKKVRSVTPTSEQLASLNLKDGRNFVTFSFSTAMLGKQQVDARIYLWKWNTQIVVSDVDGTITKSDVLGQFMPLVGRDWSQTGVAHLFSAIKENGYQLLFLSARAISQAYLTRQFLFNLKQDGKALPDGPVVISPDGLFPSLYREVIRRAPHEFKISCLEEIRALFPPECNPFYAGFGNRDTDEISYLKVGIPKGKIFIINPKGEVAVNRRVDTKSYTSLHSLVNAMFPAMPAAEQEYFNSWNYWKLPLPDIDV